MFNSITTIFQQSEILMLVSVSILMLIGVVMHKIFQAWKLLLLPKDDSEFEAAFWKEL